MLIGLLLGTIGYLFGFSSTHFWILIASFTIGEFLLNTGVSILDALIVLVIPEENRGLALGCVSTLCTLAGILSNTAYGFFSDLFCVKYTFLFALVLFLVVLLISTYICRKTIAGIAKV